MTAQIVDPRPETQAPKLWNQPTAIAQIGDYFSIPFIPMMQVVDRDVLESGQIWLLVKPTTASGTEEWVLSPEAEQPPAPQPEPQPKSQPQTQPQPSGFSGDSVACQMLELEVAPQQKAPVLQPTPDVEAEEEQGRMHGQHDATARLHPIYIKPVDAYATGYLAGYSSHHPSQQPQGRQPVEWSVHLESAVGLVRRLGA